MPSIGSRLTADLRLAIAFFTCLPLACGTGGEKDDLTRLSLARAGWAFPVAGAVVGGAAALTLFLGSRLGLAAAPAAALALATTLAITGCLHEDGLADTADGFGGGNSRERKLEIMRDGRIGSYGAGALMMSLLLRFSALAALTRPAAMTMLIAAHIAARAALPAVMRLVPPARTDGLSRGAGSPAPAETIIAALLGGIALVLALGTAAGIAALVLVALACMLMARLSLRQIGGITGDVLGAIEQVNEILVLLVGAAILQDNL
jgi:adenosylcobinamide-GDP ribazoletransferase